MLYLYTKRYIYKIVPNSDKMVFVRTKKIKEKEYAYLVENKWTKKGPRQKTKEYLGKVYSFSRVKDDEFYNFYKEYNLELRSKKEIIIDIIKLELFNHGFWKQDGIWTKNDCFIDLKKLNFFNSKNKPIAIKINDGYMCKQLISKLIKLKIDIRKEEIEKEGYLLAKLLVESGLKTSPEIFVRLYELTKI